MMIDEADRDGDARNQRGRRRLRIMKKTSLVERGGGVRERRSPSELSRRRRVDFCAWARRFLLYVPNRRPPNLCAHARCTKNEHTRPRSRAGCVTSA